MLDQLTVWAKRCDIVFARDTNFSIARRRRWLLKLLENTAEFNIYGQFWTINVWLSFRRKPVCKYLFSLVSIEMCVCAEYLKIHLFIQPAINFEIKRLINFVCPMPGTNPLLQYKSNKILLILQNIHYSNVCNAGSVCTKPNKTNKRTRIAEN